VSGGAALADGRIALIVDCDALSAAVHSTTLGSRRGESAIVSGFSRAAA
jgi:chemotaxis protein histidine kinase CheA